MLPAQVPPVSQSSRKHFLQSLTTAARESRVTGSEGLFPRLLNPLGVQRAQAPPGQDSMILLAKVTCESLAALSAGWVRAARGG